MTRLNLYDYRYGQSVYQKKRCYYLLALGVGVALAINCIIYAYYQIKITRQQYHNLVLMQQVSALEAKLVPIREYEQRVKRLQQQTILLNDMENKNITMLQTFNQLDSLVLSPLYLSSLTVSESIVTISGSSRDMNAIATLVDALARQSAFFYNVVLQSNIMAGDNYNFTISCSIAR